MSLLDLVGNAATGGVLGLVGSLGAGVVSLFQAKSQFAHDEAMGELNLKLIAAQSDAASRVSADALKTMTEQQAGQAFTASQMACASVNAPPGPRIAGILSLWRPVLTASLMGMTVWYYQTASAEMRAWITQAMVTATFTAVSWWFGSRQMEKAFAGKTSTE